MKKELKKIIAGAMLILGVFVTLSIILNAMQGTL